MPIRISRGRRRTERTAPVRSSWRRGLAGLLSQPGCNVTDGNSAADRPAKCRTSATAGFGVLDLGHETRTGDFYSECPLARRGCEHMFVPSYSESEARAAVALASNHAQVLRLLGLCPTGGSTAVLKQWLIRWEIPTDHFEPRAHRSPKRTATPLEQILVEGSTFARSNLKARLYREGIKMPICELCGVGESWHGRPVGLILDHINGIRDDQPPGEPADRVSKLRGHARHPLRTQEPLRASGALLPAMRCDLPGTLPEPALLLARVRHPRAALRPRRSEPRATARTAAALRAAAARDRRDELPRRRARVRRLGQRGSQVGAPVRTGAAVLVPGSRGGRCARPVMTARDRAVRRRRRVP